MNITQQLADALRALQAQHCTHFEGSRWKDSDDDAQAAADRALSAYDAQQVAAHGAWRVEDYAVSNGESGVCIKEGDDTVLDLPFMPAWPESTQRARAARIVQCVNAHDGIVSALQNALPYVDKVRDLSGGDGDIAAMNARAALAQAGVTP